VVGELRIASSSVVGRTRLPDIGGPALTGLAIAGDEVHDHPRRPFARSECAAGRRGVRHPSGVIDWLHDLVSVTAHHP